MKKLYWIFVIALGGFILIITYFSNPYELDFSCKVDNDCIIGIRLDTCCSCPQIYSKKDVDRNPNLIVYESGKDYSSLRTVFCGRVLCEPCETIFGVICSNSTLNIEHDADYTWRLERSETINVCQKPKTWEEFLRICPDIKENYLKNNCYISAALNAYEEVKLDKAIELCNIEHFNKSSLSNPNIEEREFCLGEVGRKILEKNPDVIVDFCFENLDKLQSRCLKEAGETIAETDIESGVKICEKISIKYDGDNFQRDACYHNIAVIARQTNETKALELCEMMLTRVEDCKDLIIKYCTIYSC